MLVAQLILFLPAKPRARVSWYSDGKLIHDSDVLVPNHPRRLVTNELTIKRLDRSHLHATFVCHAQNEDKSERKVSRENNYLSATIPTTLRTANITIDMNRKFIDKHFDTKTLCYENNVKAHFGVASLA